MLRNKVIAFPTDTVYGVGASILMMRQLKESLMKHRTKDKPLAILSPKVESVIPFVEVKIPTC